MTRVLVTGGSLGIGLGVARALATSGHELVLVARGADALEEAAGSLPGRGHAWHALDVSDEEAWKRVPIDGLGGLVCAAALMDPIGPVGEYAISDFRRTLDVNLVGTLCAIQWCLPALRTHRGAIVTFGGGGATAPLPRFDAYAASKAAISRLTENLASAIAPVTINCVAPGFVATRLHERTLAAGPAAAGAEFYERTRSTLDRGGDPAERAAALVEYLLSGVRFSGKLVSAQWDPWEEEAFLERLATDASFCTIRRIDGMSFEVRPDES